VHSALAFAPVLIIVPVFAFLLPVLFRLMRPSQPSELTVEWFENFHVSSYSPMRGLLAQDDFEFLSRQPGFDPSLYRKLRRDRLRIFREYMNRLVVDYNRLHTLANFVVSQSTEDQSQLFARLLALRFRFWLSTMQVEFSYLLCRLGGKSVSLGHILQQMEDISKIALCSPAKELLVN
jgi:hypothetical protein